MRYLILIFLLAFPLAASAVENPPGQIAIDAGHILRGRFVEERQMKGAAQPVQITGHFVVAPARGLIWGIEKPFPTSTIVTPKGSVQDVGGMAIKLSIKNLAHLYDMVDGALSGDWSHLETDFIITPSAKAGHWQMLLTPRPNVKSLPYTSITVSGSRYVETIVLLSADGGSDTMNFSDAVLAVPPLTATEDVAFNEVGR